MRHLRLDSVPRLVGVDATAADWVRDHLQRELDAGRVGEGTARRRMAAAASFYAHCGSFRRGATNPFAGLRRPVPTDRPPPRRCRCCGRPMRRRLGRGHAGGPDAADGCRVLPEARQLRLW